VAEKESVRLAGQSGCFKKRGISMSKSKAIQVGRVAKRSKRAKRGKERHDKLGQITGA